MRRGRRAKFVWLLSGVVVLASTHSGLAQQSAEQVVTDLNQGAMEAYNAMDINKAGSMLEEALRVAATGGVQGPLLAQTNMNLAIVYIGGLSDNDGGVKYFVDALCADPASQLDPLTSTPDIQSVFQVAQQKVQQTGCPSGPGMGPGAAAASVPLGSPVTHVSPPEQLTQTPLPLYAEVSPAARAKSVKLAYKGMGMDQWKRVTMFRYQSGFAYQISCNDVWEPKVQYYIEAVGASGNVVGSAGSASAPIEVPVVASRTQGEVALPGAVPPASCVAQECPPGVAGCAQSGTAAIGDACADDNECQSGLACEEDQCVLRGAGGTEVPAGDEGGDGGEELPPGWGDGDDDDGGDPKDFKRGFFQLGLAAGFTYVQAGMLADRPPPENRIFVDRTTSPPRYVEDPLNNAGLPQLRAGDPSDSAHAVPDSRFLFAGTRPDPMDASGMTFIRDEATETAWVPDADSEDSAGPVGGECAADGTSTGPMGGGFDNLLPSRYCVRVKSPGFVPGLALRTALGYFVTQDLSLALLMRYQFAAGETSFSHMLLGARIEYNFTKTKAKGLMVSGYLGGTFGQIQAQPPATGNTAGAPWVKSGLQGGHIGSNIRYRFHKNFGIYLAPELDLQFPTFLWHVELLSGGIEAAF